MGFSACVALWGAFCEASRGSRWTAVFGAALSFVAALVCSVEELKKFLQGWYCASIALFIYLFIFLCVRERV
ncbi:hypothetical protein J3F83DRAFT_748051, partial [Trichoderma novae-zelandiae]